MKIYTRRGDEGSTQLRGGDQVSKDSARIEAIGAVDELNAVIGRGLARRIDSRLRNHLATVQDLLFRLGSDLARPGAREESAGVEQASVEQLEGWIDQFSAELPELRNFVLPGGTPLAADLHWARTVCRRAERRTQTLAAQEPVSPAIVPFLNRLGDLLFVLARWANARAGRKEKIWKADSQL